MVTNTTFSKAGDEYFRKNRRLFCAIIITTAAYLAVQVTKGTGLELVLEKQD